MSILMAVIDFFRGIWSNLPEHTKEEIKEKIIKGFEDYFNDYFDFKV